MRFIIKKKLQINPCGNVYICNVLKRSLFILSLALLPLAGIAQKMISGIVVDSAFGKPMASVVVENISTKTGTKTNYRGTFTIEASNDNYLKISYTGYKPRIIRVQDVDDIDFLNIKLAIGRIQLKEVKITKPLTPYQRDSVERAKIYDDIFNYKQEKSAMSPVTSVYQMFSKKHKNQRKFKEQVLDMEKQKFIDTRYTQEIVEEITNLQGDELAYFMNAYPMDLDFARTASELELRMWVRYNWADYQKKNQGKE